MKSMSKFADLNAFFFFFLSMIEKSRMKEESSCESDLMLKSVRALSDSPKKITLGSTMP